MQDAIPLSAFLSFKNHHILKTKNICIEEKVIIRINFNPGLTLIGFRTILPCFNELT